MFRRAFSFGYLALILVATLGSSAALIGGGQAVWYGALLAAAAPLAQRIRPYDRTPPIHHKVRLPLVSLLVLGGAAWVLLVTPGRHPALWTTLACLGGFLLDTYWAREEQTR